MSDTNSPNILRMSYILLLLALLPSGVKQFDLWASDADDKPYKYCSDLGYCIDLPRTMMVISQKNYTDFVNVLPEEIIKGFRQHESKEIVLDKTKNYNKVSFFIILVTSPGIKNINIPGTCAAYKRLEGKNLIKCGQIKNYNRIGIKSLTYSNTGRSYVRVWLELTKTTHIYAVSVMTVDKEYLFRRLAFAMIKILKTIRIKDG